MTETAVRNAVNTVDDPEYSGLSISELGLVETVTVLTEGRVEVGLIPTFSGCPALAMIAEDVERAVRSVDGVTDVSVQWLRSPTWSMDRLTEQARDVLAEEFTVAVRIGDQPPLCPRCGSPTTETSMFGPSRCRSVHRCEHCTETVEVMRG